MAPRIALVANSDWYLFHFRGDLARELRDRWGAEVLCVSPDGPYRARLQAGGFQWAPLRLCRQGLNPFQELLALQDLTRLYRGFRPDLVHHFTLKPVLYGSLAAARTGVPRVVNALAGLGTVFSGTTARGRWLRYPVSLALKRVMGRRGSLCILQNPEDAALVQGLLLGRAGLVRLIRGSGVDTARFSPSPHREDARVVLFVGRMLKDKGVPEFCAAAALLQARAPQLEFWAVGAVDPGNPGSLSEAELARLGRRSSNLRFLGHQEAMAELYRKALVLVLPTRYGEGVPRSLLEGAACGLPLIATDHPGCREIVRPGVNGFLVPPGDPGAIAACVLALAADPARRQRLGRESRRIAVEGFGFEQVFRSTMQVYEELGLTFDPLEQGVHS